MASSFFQDQGLGFKGAALGPALCWKYTIRHTQRTFLILVGADRQVSARNQKGGDLPVIWIYLRRLSVGAVHSWKEQNSTECVSGLFREVKEVVRQSWMRRGEKIFESVWVAVGCVGDVEAAAAAGVAAVILLRDCWVGGCEAVIDSKATMGELVVSEEYKT